LSYTKIPTLTTSMQRLVPLLNLSKLYPRGTRLLALSTILVFSACDMVTDNAPSPFKAFSHFCCIKTASIFTFYNPKSLSLVNFSISHFEPIVLDYRLILAPRWAPIVVNSLKNHTNKILDVWRKVIKQQILTWVTVITQAKVE